MKLDHAGTSASGGGDDLRRKHERCRIDVSKDNLVCGDGCGGASGEVVVCSGRVVAVLKVCLQIGVLCSQATDLAVDDQFDCAGFGCRSRGGIVSSRGTP